jgi:hypothetical protein
MGSIPDDESAGSGAVHLVVARFGRSSEMEQDRNYAAALKRNPNGTVRKGRDPRLTSSNVLARGQRAIRRRVLSIERYQ